MNEKTDELGLLHVTSHLRKALAYLFVVWILPSACTVHLWPAQLQPLPDPGQCRERQQPGPNGKGKAGSRESCNGMHT